MDLGWALGQSYRGVRAWRSAAGQPTAPFSVWHQGTRGYESWVARPGCGGLGRSWVMGSWLSFQ